MTTLIDAVLMRVNYINNEIDSAKDEFAALIVNKDFSLQERWQLFREAPSYLKNEASWIEHIMVGEQDLADNLCGYENRRQIIDVVELIDNAREAKSEEDDIEYPEDAADNWLENVILSNEAEFDNAKEYILSRNLGSFCYDW